MNWIGRTSPRRCVVFSTGLLSTFYDRQGGPRACRERVARMLPTIMISRRALRRRDNIFFLRLTCHNSLFPL